MEGIELIDAEMEFAKKPCPHCNALLQAKDVIGIGVHAVSCEAAQIIVKEPFTFYIVECPRCQLKGTVDSLMNKGDMMNTTSQVWNKLIHVAWGQYGNSSNPTKEFIADRKGETLDRFFTFTRKKHSNTTDIDGE